MSKTYTTVQGDMWDSIAYKQLGDIYYTDKLLNLNPAYCDMFVFPAGIVLQLPEKMAHVEESLPPWKRVGK